MQLNLNWLPRFLRQRILNYVCSRNTKTVNALAPKIRNNKQFRKIVMAAQPSFRRAVYDHLKPQLNFKAKPYFLLIK